MGWVAARELCVVSPSGNTGYLPFYDTKPNPLEMHSVRAGCPNINIKRGSTYFSHISVLNYSSIFA